ncbi:uncharacterized protein LOC100182705 isoform X1 [Ciona intestinalis]
MNIFCFVLLWGGINCSAFSIEDNSTSTNFGIPVELSQEIEEISDLTEDTKFLTTTLPIPTSKTLAKTDDENFKSNCGTQIFKGKKSGYIKSPGFPGYYDNNVTCLWSIVAPAGFYVKLTFDNFGLEKGIEDDLNEKISCEYDYVYVFEEFWVEQSFRTFRSSRSRMRRDWGTYCGSNVPPVITSLSPGSTLFLYFHSDESETRKGFFATFQILQTRGRSAVIPWENTKHSREREIMKVLSMIVLTVVLGTVFSGLVYKCLRSTADLGNQCCALEDNVSPEVPDPCSPHRLPTPPPAYGEVVKTEEDWNRVIAQLGEASAIALRQRLDTEQLQITYDLSPNDVIDASPPGYSSASSSLTTDSNIDLTLTPNSSTTIQNREELLENEVGHFEYENETAQRQMQSNSSSSRPAICSPRNSVPP